ncbi:hypothetical protein GCM10009745_70840 [Kribbella yunnanensis]|uniref:Uncharacterized protein n=1 Tax=Kribbella yunnanensis TaxID=190194 RepID=A0ABP4UZR1_9ACTN
MDGRSQIHGDLLIEAERRTDIRSEVAIDQGPCIVDQDIQPAEALSNSLQHRGSVGRNRDVGLDSKRPRVFLREAIKSRLRPATDSHRCPLEQECLRETQTDTGGTAGDKDNAW